MGSNSPEPSPNAIVSHKWVLRERAFGGGPRVVDYFTCPELQLVAPGLAPAWTDSIATIGVYCHEFGHMLGLPDYYDTSSDESRIGVWDVMDYGTWNRIGRLHSSFSAYGSLPGHFSAWSKMFLGWTTPLELAPSFGEEVTEVLTLDSASLGGRPAQLLANSGGIDWENGDPGFGEFFVVETRTRDGYDRGLPNEGVLVYHVDESRANNRASDFADGGGLLLLEPQNNGVSITSTQAAANEVWPGVQTAFGSNSIPSSRRHQGVESGVSIDAFDTNSISLGSASITATVVNLDSPFALPYAQPNPWRPTLTSDVEIVLSIGTPAVAPTRVAIFDVLGRRIRSLSSASIHSTGRRASWDGRTSDGAPAVPGVYFFRVEAPTTGPAGRVVLLR
jgi:hypothetical protein